MISSGSNAQRLADIVRGLQEAAPGTSVPLHRYRIDDQRMAELERLLSARLAEANPNLSRAESAAFVLYSAHHFAHAYTGGQWTWAIVKGVIDPEARLAPPILYEVVERGLQAWSRTVFWNGRHNEYLYTIGREGGLPLGVLMHDRGEGLRTFLQRLLTRIETSTVSADEAANELQHHLPPQLRQPEVMRLAAELVRRLAELRESVPRDVSPSIAWMDEHEPGWRDHLPVRTNDAVAAALIGGLVQQARSAGHDREFALVTLLVGGRLQRTLKTPKRVKAERLLGAERTTLPSRLRISVSNGAALSTRAIATRLGDDEYIIERLAAEPLQSAEWFANDVRLVLGVGERELSSSTLAGGESDGSAALPWVFDAAATGGWQLAARGSYSSKSSALMVAYRAKAGEMKAPAGVLEHVGEDPILGWTLTRVCGVARWETDQDICEIEAGRAASGGHYELKGRSERLAGTGSFVWRGCPDVYSRSTHGVATRIPDGRLEWRSTRGNQPWQRSGPACLGEVELRVREGACTSYRTRVTVIPVDLQLELSPSHATEGEIRIQSTQVTRAHVLSPGVEETPLAGPPRLTLRLRSARPPADIELEVHLGSAAQLRLRLPFPSEFCGFVSVDGEALPAGGRIGLDMLSRWAARAVSCDPDQSYVLEAQTELGPRTLAELPPSGTGVAELPLSRLRTALEACLSGTRNIDEFVSLRVSRRTGPLVAAAARSEARLGWHETQLDVVLDDSAATIQLDPRVVARLADWQVRDFHVLARPLHAPAAEPVQLDGDAHAGWFFSPGEERRWLLTGWVGHALMTRPRMVQFEALPSQPPPFDGAVAPTIERAMRAPALDERRTLLGDVYGVLASDYGHPDWQRVDEFARTLHELPPTTYDVVCALAAAKPAAVAAVLRQPRAHFDAVWTGLDRLGVSWHTLPIGLWLRAARLGRDFAFTSPHADLLGGKQALLKQILPGLLEAGEDRPRFFGVIVAALKGLGFPDDAQGLFVLERGRTREGRAFLRQQIREACIDLRRRAVLTGDRFPLLRVSDHSCCPHIDELLERFGLMDQVPYTWECLAAPLAAAVIMVNGHTVTAGFLDDLRLLRSFDEEWFDYAHAMALAVMVGNNLENDDAFCDRAESQLLGPNG